MKGRMVALAIAVAACTGSTKLTHVQVAPEAQRAKVQNVLVIGLFRDPAARQSYEYTMVDELKRAGVRAQASQDLFPIGKVPSREDVRELVERMHFDGTVVGRLVDTRTSVRATTAPVAVEPGFYDWYGWAGPYAYAPVLETSTSVIVETRVFETTNGTPEFQASSESIDPRSAVDVSKGHAKLVVGELQKNGLV